jgi:transcriptional regulator with XRE-family HTH domain
MGTRASKDAAKRDDRPSKADEANEVRIGSRVRHARLLKGFNLRRLAEAVGCSESLISKVENNKARPSIATFHRIAKALETNMAALLGGPDFGGAPVEIMRSGCRPVLRVGAEYRGEGMTLERIIPQFRGMLLQANLLQIDPGGFSDGLIEHDGEEFGYVIEGELELAVSGSVHLIRAGDSFYFPSHLPHCYRNAGSRVARVMWVNTPPTF